MKVHSTKDLIDKTIKRLRRYDNVNLKTEHFKVNATKRYCSVSSINHLDKIIIHISIHNLIENKFTYIYVYDNYETAGEKLTNALYKMELEMALR